MSNDYFFNQITWSKATTIDGQECYLSSLLVVKGAGAKEVQYAFFCVIERDIHNVFTEYASPTMIEEQLEGVRPRTRATSIEVYPKDLSLTESLKEMLRYQKKIITGLYQGEEALLLSVLNMRIKRNSVQI